MQPSNSLELAMLAWRKQPIQPSWSGPHVHGLVLLTHDRKTMAGFAYDRIAAGLPMPGVFLVADDMLAGNAIDEILIAASCLSEDECKNRVWYFPL